jgi:hypothetical protein
MNCMYGRTLVTAVSLALGAQAAQAAAPGGGEPVTAEVVITNNDQNKDGVVTKAEAVATGRQLAQAWDTFDTNKDGKVDVEEVRKVLAAQQGGGPPAVTPPAAAPPATGAPAR